MNWEMENLRQVLYNFHRNNNHPKETDDDVDEDQDLQG